ncbi:hypothetical protein [Pseudomonas moraviensis]|uniref:Uncharacterized protein n=1 Tax=Pseudomonas moraviensis TaxID=321662 RepID=A0A7Y9VYZ0_9PSED|nr:hypothetical protein [Pseudomonas moraviensis]NYH10448.1 hypothetical protein [Pseudomonas moraviensis]
MHKTLYSLTDELELLIQAIGDSFTDDSPLNIGHDNWTFPGLTGTELMEMAQSLIQLAVDRGDGTESSLVNEVGIIDYIARINYLRTNTIPNTWSSAAAGVSAYVLTLDGLRRLLDRALPSTKQQDLAKSLQAATKQVRAMESRLKDLDERSADLEGMVARIQRAHDAADQLPTDLDALKEARKELEKLLRGSEVDRAHILSAREATDEIVGKFQDNAAQADAVLSKCDSAYASATSQGLAGAFADRSKKLDSSMWIWVVGLVLSLGLGGYFGAIQLKNLADTLSSPTTSQIAMGFHLVMTLMSIGAPVWFAWLSTKQIGQRFRISEDYAFKASISKAYEGYRREAARIDPDLEVQLLGSALARLDEQPLRLVESSSYGSPWHELLASDLIKDAVKSVPGFAENVAKIARESIANLKPKTAPAVAANTNITPVADDTGKVVS